MLHKKTIEPKTFALLSKLQGLSELSKFQLVGGTALALQFGHRISIDIDLFGPKLDKVKILPILKKEFNEFQFIETGERWNLFCKIEGIKVDIIEYTFSPTHPIISESGIRMIHYKDIAAMKINAILNRGTKKDFWDVVELLDHLSLQEIISLFEKKYPENRLLISIPQALVYFEDAEHSPDPICLRKRKWSDVKNKLRSEVDQFLS